MWGHVRRILTELPQMVSGWENMTTKLLPPWTIHLAPAQGTYPGCVGENREMRSPGDHLDVSPSPMRVQLYPQLGGSQEQGPGASWGGACKFPRQNQPEGCLHALGGCGQRQRVEQTLWLRFLVSPPPVWG